MPCGTIVPAGDLEFGIADDEASLNTQSVSVTKKKDKKEARDKCGNICTLAFYNGTCDIQITGLGKSATSPGASLSLSSGFGTVAGAIYVDEVSIEKSNEDFVKSTIKATAYEGISAGGA